MKTAARALCPLLWALVVCAALLFSPAAAETLLGRCVGVADGDTCTLLLTSDDGTKRTEKIRFHGIDAPESHQAYGKAAKKFVSDLIFGKDIAVDVQTRDKYGRLVGKIRVGDTDVNLAVVKAGYAWWYRRYGAGETALAEAEQDARAARRGLWQDKDPVAPWDFRHKPALAQQAVERPAAPFTDTLGAAPAADKAAARYWVTSSSGKTHNASCRWYGTSKGYYSSTSTGNNCLKCGGAGYSDNASITAPSASDSHAVTAPANKAAERYWVTSSSGKTHNASCRWYANSKGYYSSTGTGNNCKVCGGAN